MHFPCLEHLHSAPLLLGAATAWIDALAWLYALVMGAAVGSFLNVVVYRLPRGLSLLWPGSRCPNCEQPIHAQDNVPVLGWLLLRGRCRACRAPISPRYPLVEILVGSLFASLMAAEVLSAGANLPTRIARPAGAANTLLDPQFDLLALYALHLTLLCGTLVVWLTALDRMPVPRMLSGAIIAIGALANLAWPELLPVAASAGVSADWMRGLLNVACGGALGALLAAAWLPVGGNQRYAGVFSTLLATGVFLGWQAAAMVSLLAAALQFAVAIIAQIVPRLHRVPAACWIWWALAAQVFAWRQVHQLLSMRINAPGWLIAVGAACGSLLLSVSSGWLLDRAARAAAEPDAIRSDAT